MRRTGGILLFLGLIILFVGCAAKKNPPLVSGGYRDWKRTHLEELDYPIPGHEDKYRRIFINSSGERPEIGAADGKRSYVYPEGTQVVKEIYDKTSGGRGEPSMLTVMVKKSGHPSARAGWLWIVKNPGTGEETIIAEEFCITCHSNANEKHPYGDRNPKEEFRDFLFFPFPRP